jgi:putative membrane protein
MEITKDMVAALNASLNGLATLLLIAAFVAIKKKAYAVHGWLMVSSLLTSAVFLVFYLGNLIVFGNKTTASMGLNNSTVKIIYFATLIPHVLAAIVMLPMIFMALFYAWKRNWAAHKKIAFPTWCIWVYVSVSGVIVYWQLYHWIPAVIEAEKATASAF